MQKIFAAMLAAGLLTACNSGNKQTTDKDMEQTLQLTQEPNEQREQSGACSNFAESRERKSEAQWDKVFPQSDKVEHSKITFHNRYGITLVADMYTPSIPPKEGSMRPSPSAARSEP